MEIDQKTFSLATISVLSCVVSELSKKGLIDLGALVENIQGTAATHRQKGNAQMADAMHRLSEYMLTSVPDKG